jgi:hypothetical protein
MVVRRGATTCSVPDAAAPDAAPGAVVAVLQGLDIKAGWIRAQ